MARVTNFGLLTGDVRRAFKSIQDSISAEITALDVRLTDVEGDVTPSTWTAPTFVNSWVNFGAGEADAAYRKIGDIVYLRGLIKSGTTNATAFVLPTGFRPPAVINLATVANDAIAHIRIDTSGNVIIPTYVSNTWVSLSGLMFSVV